MEISDIEGQISNKEKILNSFITKMTLIQSRLSDINDRVLEIASLINLYTESSELSLEALTLSRFQLSERFSNLATEALSTIFIDQELKFIAKMDIQRKQSTLKFKILIKDREIDPMTSMGGGVIDVLSLVLRLVIIELFHINGPLMLDEPFSHVSREYLKNCGNFLKQYSKITNRQIFLITHSPEFCEFADSLFEVRLSKDHNSIVEKI